MPTIRDHYGCYVESTGHVFNEPSITQQQFKNDADINYIVQMYDSTGVYPGQTGASPRQPQFGDFAALPENAQEAYNQILAARDDFNSLPLAIRQRFNYDAGAFFDFVQDPANVDELVALGLATKTEIAPPAATLNNTPNNTPNNNNNSPE